jgi:peptide/nickel transport system substrate-binding protein
VGMQESRHDGGPGRDEHRSVPSSGLEPDILSQDPLTRRRFMLATGSAGLGLAASGLLAACGGGGKSSTAAGTSSGPALGGPPPRVPGNGGTLRVGYIGNGTSETFDPALGNTPIDSFRGYCVFDPLMRVGADHKLEPGLATGWDHNADATVWEIRLRDGVTWHDGKPFTADDVIYTLRTLGRPDHLGNYAGQNIRLNELKKLSDTLVRVPLKIPIGELQQYFGYFNAAIVVQDGTKNFNKPVGTGPYKLDTFTPGTRTTFSANRDYWDSPKPYPDKLELVDIDDDTARVNALLSGQIDICGLLNSTQARAGLHGSQYQVLVGAYGLSACFNMRVDQAPFNDVKVRQAMKLLADRQGLINAALNGFGDVGNDLAGKGFPHYNNSLPQRQHDVEQAKSLLKSAGQSDLRFTLTSTDAGLGQLQAAQAYIQQVKSAGISGAQLKVVPPSNYYNPNLLFTKMTFAQNIWAIGSLQAFYAQSLVKGAPLHETHWSSPSFDALYYKTIGETDPTKAQQYWDQLQKIQWDQGGYIFWALVHNLDGLSNRVAGVGGPGVGWAYPTGDQRVWDWGLIS